MRKNLWLIMIALGLLEHESFAQTQLGQNRHFCTDDGASLNLARISKGESYPGINVKHRYNRQPFFLFSQNDTLLKAPSVEKKVKSVNVALKPATNVSDTKTNQNDSKADLIVIKNTDQDSIKTKNIIGNKSAKNLENSPVIKPADIIEKKNIIAKSNPALAKSENTQSEFKPSAVKKAENNISDLQIINLESPYVIDKDKLLYAVILSPFKDKQEAVFIKSRLLAVFNTQSILYADGSNFKIRIPGFRYHTEAELYAHQAINSGFKNKFYIIPYEIKSVNPLIEAPKIIYKITETD